MIYISGSCFQERDMLIREIRLMQTRVTIQKTHSSAMEVRRHKSKGTTPCPYCSCAVNNFHIGRHISREHTQRAAAAPLSTRDVEDPNTPPPNNDAPVRDEAQIEDDSNIEAELDDEDDEDDEAEKTVEDYLRDLTDETYRTDIQYDPKRVLKYLS